MFNGSKVRNLIRKGRKQAVVTCEQCGSISGQGVKGDSWICDDCRVKLIPVSDEEQAESESRSQSSSEKHRLDP